VSFRGRVGGGGGVGCESRDMRRYGYALGGVWA